MVAFRLETGAPQLVLLGIGAFFSAGSSGPTAAMVANLTHPSVQASASARSPWPTTCSGSRWVRSSSACWPTVSGLLSALQIAPVVYVLAVAALLLGKRMLPASACASSPPSTPHTA